LRNRHKRILFSVVTLLIVAAACELVGRAVYWSRFGEGYRREWILQVGGEAPAGPELGADEALDELDRSRPRWLRTDILHPYLGFTRQEGDFDAGLGLVANGPLMAERGDSRVVVALTGGSVASYCAPVLESEFNRRLEASGSARRVRIQNLAQHGFKQPQQLMALTFALTLGARFDLVVNLDGFNEVALAEVNVLDGVHPAYPRK
jgi:hypothetical protein